MKQYLKNGASAYLYWNISLDEGGFSRWGWQQNSLVTVNPAEKTYKFNHESFLTLTIPKPFLLTFICSVVATSLANLAITVPDVSVWIYPLIIHILLLPLVTSLVADGPPV